MKKWLSFFFATAFLLSGLLPACESVIGIEDRELADPLTAQLQKASPQCLEYCNQVLDSCTGEFAVYSGMATCLGVCALLEPGDPLEPAGNTVACRMDKAKKAASTGEPNVYCERAGPGGKDTCGSNCESYCHLLDKACHTEFQALTDCPAQCKALRDDNKFDVIVNHDDDSLQCRLVHVSSASVNPDGHCAHTRLPPTSPCVDPPTSAPNCTDYCQVVMTACTGDKSVYESEAQCLATCDALPKGQADQKTDNTVGCRKYHAYNALLDPAMHCAHAGPTGDGHCGKDTETSYGNCESYCQVVAAACPAPFTQTFADQAACMSACFAMPATFTAVKDMGYSTLKAASGNTVQCRVLHAAQAFGDKLACAAALGGSPCN